MLGKHTISNNEAALKKLLMRNYRNKTNKRQFKVRQILDTRSEQWQGKPLHGQYLRDIEGKIDKKNICMVLVKDWDLKKETEGFIMAAQDLAIRPNAIRAKIDKTTGESKYRLCKEKEESIDHLVSSYSKIAQKDYKERPNKVVTMLHWNLYKKYHLRAADKWWEHKTLKVLQNYEAKILWDIKIQTNKHLAHNIPDITVVEATRM